MNVTYNYWCTHSCNDGKYIKITKDETEGKREELCPTCNKPMKKMGVLTNFWLGSFDSKSPSEKKEILKKREREHTKNDKQFQEYKDHLDNENR